MATNAKKELKPVILVWGSDEYEVAKKARELVELSCPAAEQAFGLETIDGRADTIDATVAAINKCLTAIRTVGFFGASKTIWLRDATFLAPAKGAEEEEGGGDEKESTNDAKERLAVLTEEIKKGIPDGQRFIVSAVSVHRGWPIYKALKAAGEVIEFNPPEKGKEAGQATEDYVANAFREAGLQPARGVIEIFLDRTGRDTRQIRNEVEKLRLYVGARKEVRAEDVRAIVSATREAISWDLTEAMGKRNLPGALGLLRQLLAQRESPQMIIAMIESRLRDLIVLRQCLDRRWVSFSRSGNWVNVSWRVVPEADDMLAKLPKDPRTMNKFRVGFMVEEASRFTFEELLRAHRLTTEAHEKMVSSPVPQDILLEHLLISVMQKPAHATR